VEGSAGCEAVRQMRVRDEMNERSTHAAGQKTRMMIGCRYPSITEIAAEDKIALN
jgi:hypothetical protein